MNRKRDRLEVIHDFLLIIRKHNNSIRRTPLMRQANLSTQRFTEYLRELKQKELIREMQDKKSNKFILLRMVTSICNVRRSP